MNKEECLFLSPAWSQRISEDARGLSRMGTNGFEQTGCYECDGFNKECRSYVTKQTIEEVFREDHEGQRNN